MHQIQIHHNDKIVKTFDGQDGDKMVDRACCWISGHYPGSVWHMMRYEGVRMFKFDLAANTAVEIYPAIEYINGRQSQKWKECIIAPIQKQTI